MGKREPVPEPGDSGVRQVGDLPEVPGRDCRVDCGCRGRRDSVPSWSVRRRCHRWMALSALPDCYCTDLERCLDTKGCFEGVNGGIQDEEERENEKITKRGSNFSNTKNQSVYN